jgi:hypothetical protein
VTIKIGCTFFVCFDSDCGDFERSWMGRPDSIGPFSSLLLGLLSKVRYKRVLLERKL